MPFHLSMKRVYALFLSISLMMMLALLTGDSVMAQSSVRPIRQSADLQQLWQTYQQRYITDRDAGAAPRLRVLNGQGAATTYSEGQAYGMLMAAYLDDQPVFDALWLYAADHLNQNGLMVWLIEGSTISDAGAATDADVDMAMALLVACDNVRRDAWSVSSHGIDYCESARAMIDAIWQHEIDHPGIGPDAGLNDNPGYELLPGDSWCLECNYPAGIVNLSYFPPGYFRVFAEFTGNDDWYRVNERNYEIASLAQANSCAGFVSNWNTYDGDPQIVPWQGASSRYWGWDGARFAWRVAIDAYWYDSPQAFEALQPIANFFASINASNIRAEYRIDGTPVNNYNDVYFQVHAGAAVWAVNNPVATECGQASGNLRSTAADIHNYIARTDQNTYYSDSWRLLGLMLMNGLITRPELTDTAPPPDPEPSATATNTPTPIPSATSTPAATDTDVPPTMTPRPSETPFVEPTRPPIVRPDATNTPRNVRATATPSEGSSILQIASKDSGPRNEQNGHFRYRLTNNGQQAQSNINVRFYFTPAPRDATDYMLDTYYDSSNAASVSEPIPVSDTLYYFEVQYSTSLAPGDTWEFQGNIRLSDWQHDQTPADDFWRNSPTAPEYRSTNALPVFVNGQLVTGQTP